MLLAVGCLLLSAAPSCGLHCAAPSALPPAPSDRATPSLPLKHHRVWAARHLRGGSGSRSGAYEELPPLPEGWEERVHTDGRVYYLNHIQKTTQWDRPMPAAPAAAFTADPGARAAPATMPAAAAGLMDGGFVKTFVNTYNKEMLTRYGGGRAEIEAAKGKPLSQIIHLALRPRAADQPRATLGDIVALAGYNIAFGLAIAAASAPNALGVSRLFPGLKLLLGIAPVLLALEVGMGFERPWLPGAMLSLKLSGTSLGSVSVSLFAPMAASFEQVVKPRMGFVVNVLGRLPTALVLFLLSVPFGGQLKALAMVVMGLGMLSRDGLLYLGAWAFVMLTFGVVKFVALTALVGLATVYSPNR
eukprot:Tamp_21405.p1 GENE.Tamp_21405~~Tamp_21405.p1  ORF type:complete len:370 (+),score=47.84 Tamp_21405:35-1111(+)